MNVEQAFGLFQNYQEFYSAMQKNADLTAALIVNNQSGALAQFKASLSKLSSELSSEEGGLTDEQVDAKVEFFRGQVNALINTLISLNSEPDSPVDRVRRELELLAYRTDFLDSHQLASINKNSQLAYSLYRNIMVAGEWDARLPGITERVQNVNSLTAILVATKKACVIYLNDPSALRTEIENNILGRLAKMPTDKKTAQTIATITQVIQVTLGIKQNAEVNITERSSSSATASASSDESAATEATTNTDKKTFLQMVRSLLSPKAQPNQTTSHKPEKATEMELGARSAKKDSTDNEGPTGPSQH